MPNIFSDYSRIRIPDTQTKCQLDNRYTYHALVLFSFQMYNLMAINFAHSDWITKGKYPTEDRILDVRCLVGFLGCDLGRVL